MQAGFKAVEEKLTLIQLERATEKGFELKEKGAKNAADIIALNEWKITADTTITNLRRTSWLVVSAVITLTGTVIGAAIIYWVNRPR